MGAPGAVGGDVGRAVGGGGVTASGEDRAVTDEAGRPLAGGAPQATADIATNAAITAIVAPDVTVIRP
jgi:hypothetical protein